MTSRVMADLLAAKLLINNLRGSLETPLPEMHFTPSGAAFEVYQSGPQVRTTIVFVYGILLAGERDPNVVRFARAMASAGARVVVPVLSGMKSFVFRSADRDALMDIIQHASWGNDHTAILTVSAGACLSLCAASDPRLDRHADPIVLISPVYDLNTAWVALHNQAPPQDGDVPTWDGYIWKQCAIAYRNRKLIGLSGGAIRELEDILRSYDSGLTSPEKKVFYQTRILPLKLHERKNLLRESDALQTLTPRGKLDQIHSRVIIIHGAHDPIVPPEQAGQMMDELERRAKTCEQKLLVTSMLSHEQIQRTTDLSDMLRFIHLLGELFV
jgi:pimeloyl-ACP methyl ester carboxylesterase